MPFIIRTYSNKWQPGSRWPLTAEIWFRSRTSSYEICNRQISNGTDFSASTSVLSVSFHQCSILVFIRISVLLEWQTREAWVPAKKMPFAYRGTVERKELTTYCCSFFKRKVHIKQKDLSSETFIFCKAHSLARPHLLTHLLVLVSRGYFTNALFSLARLCELVPRL
jgi:hypothetical protein